MLATNGDTFLGGEDFDLRLIEYFTSEFKADSGIDIQGDPLAMRRLKEAEKAKLSCLQVRKLRLICPTLQLMPQALNT